MGMGHSCCSSGTRGAQVSNIAGVYFSGGRRRGVPGGVRVRNGYAVGGVVPAETDELKNLSTSCGAPKKSQGTYDSGFVCCREATATGTQATTTRTTANVGYDATVRQQHYVATSTRGAR